MSRRTGYTLSVLVAVGLAIAVHRPWEGGTDEISEEVVAKLLTMAGRLGQADPDQAVRICRRMLAIDPGVTVAGVGEAMLAATERLEVADRLLMLDRLSRKAQSEAVRRGAIEGLARLARLDWLASLAVSDPDPVLREVAVRRIAEAHRAPGADAEGYLIEAGYDIAAPVRWWACRALGRVSGSDAVDRVLLDALHDPLEGVRIAAAGAILRRVAARASPPALQGTVRAWIEEHEARRAAVCSEPGVGRGSDPASGSRRGESRADGSEGH